MSIPKQTIRDIRSKINSRTNKPSKIADKQLLSQYPVARAFQESTAQKRIIMGALGSGKTTACMWEIMRIIRRQPIITEKGKFKYGWRYSQGAFIRDTYTSLIGTAVKEWRANFASVSHITGDKIVVEIPEEKVYCEIALLHLDKPNDTEKLRSMSLTWAYICEGRSIKSFDLLGDLIGRLNRQPADNQKGYLLICSNFIGVNHWLYTECYMKQDEDMKVFCQPSGLSDEAENREWLAKKYGGDHKNYYKLIMKTLTKAGVETDILAKWSYYFEGQAVYGESFDKDKHVIPVPPKDVDIYKVIDFVNLHNIAEAIKAYGYKKSIFVGIDGGIVASAYVICFKTPNNNWTVLIDRTFEHSDGRELAKALKTDLYKLHVERMLPETSRQVNYDTYNAHNLWQYIHVACDPAGNARSNIDKDKTYIKTVSEVLGMEVVPAYTGNRGNNAGARIEVLNNVLHTQRIVFHDTCKTLIAGMAGGYHRAKTNTTQGEMYKPEVEKNIYSHVVDALQYCLIGGGELELLGRGI